MSSQLPELTNEYPISPEQVAAYQRDGHIYLPQVLSSDELQAYRPVINRAADQFNTETRPIEERDTYGKAFLQIMNLWVKDDAVRRYVLAKRFAKIAADLMGVEGVRIYHDQALFKEPGGGPTPWHQDQYYWPLDTDNTITMWMPLVDVPDEVGTMTFGSGSQRLGFLGDFEISDKSDEIFKNMVAEKGLKLQNYGGMRAGDATFHSGWTLHGAPGNPTPNMREVMTIIYFADGVRISDPGDNPHRTNDLRSWLPGLKPGDFAASEINPLVYKR
jgi:ectoine hydroxylase-related dioxygenase (phytanoyl-CoA dioxygenase family)